MTTPQLQTIGNKLFSQVSAMMRAENVSEWELATIEREAKKLSDVEPGQGWIIRSAVAALKWDVEGAERFSTRAITHDPSAETFINAAVTMGYLNRPDLAKKFAEQAKAKYGLTSKIADRVLSTNLATADIDIVTEAFNKASAQDQSNPGFLCVNEAVAAMRVLSIEPSRLKGELSAAYEVLTLRKLRSFGIAANVELDQYDEPESVTITIFFLGQENEQLSIQGDLAVQLLEQPDWDPRTLCVTFRPSPTSNVH